MTVSELMSLLEDCDPGATVRIMMQESWPFENAIEGIATRGELGGEECDCDHRIGEPHEEGCPAVDGEAEYEDGLKANDVFIVEGRQERYGDKRAWSVCRRY